MCLFKLVKKLYAAYPKLVYLVAAGWTLALRVYLSTGTWIGLPHRPQLVQYVAVTAYAPTNSSSFTFSIAFGTQFYLIWFIPTGLIYIPDRRTRVTLAMLAHGLLFIHPGLRMLEVTHGCTPTLM